MKETILAIFLVLLVVLAVAFLVDSALEFTQEPQEEITGLTTEPTTAPPTQNTTEPTTQPTTEEPTEPEIVPVVCDTVFFADGNELDAFVTEEDETVIAEAQAYLKALGLDEEGVRHASEKEKIFLSEDGSSLRVNDVTYATVYQGKLYLPVLEFAEQMGYPVWEDEEFNTVYITPGAKSFEVPEGVNVPVLMYHAVSDSSWGYSELFVKPSEMEKQLAYLVDNGYDPIWFEDLAHVEDYDKPVILTFDDGYDDNYTELFPLLKKYNVKATIFIIGQDVSGINHKMNEEQIKEMADSGLVSMQSHSYTHGDMGSMSEETLEYEIGETQKVITRITGKVPYVLCYPEGKFSSRTIEVAKQFGLNFGLKMVGGLYHTSVDDVFKISRYYIARSTDIYTFSYYVSNAG